MPTRTFPALALASSARKRWLTQRSTQSEEHTSELQSPDHLVCRLLLEKKKHIRSAARQFGKRPRDDHRLSAERRGKARSFSEWWDCHEYADENGRAVESRWLRTGRDDH